MFEIAEYIGIISFAMSGFFIAARNHFDLLGTFISIFLSAFGGGIMRDVIIDKTPFIFTHDLPALIVLCVMIVMVALRLHRKKSFEDQFWFIISDSIGLVSFSIGSALIALEANLNFTGVVALAFITAVGGGIARDIIINEVPFVFRSGFYGTVSILLGVLIFLFHQADWINPWSLTALFLFGIGLRLIAYQRKWTTPLL